MLAVLRRLDHSDPEEEQYHRQDKTQTEADSPDTRRDTIIVRLNDNERNDSGDHKAEVDGEIRGHRDQEATATTDEFALVRGFGTTGATGWVFAF